MINLFLFSTQISARLITTKYLRVKKIMHMIITFQPNVIHYCNIYDHHIHHLFNREREIENER